jgi:hypothetical protein
VRLEHGEHSVHRPLSRRQLQFPDHTQETPNFFDKRIGQHQPKRHAMSGHDSANGPTELGQLFNVHPARLLRLALDVPSLVQLDHVLLPSLLRLLELDPGL